ncbi:hypothetical protein [Actinoplanes sp. ATCC 53533]|uniref:hypothetical protein n=1 Tax=Actinoplanes sp. ATCC 53533 TaxID=1288362 RepID=UPI000F76CD00|nr:hypothetical protein [Actinoplanes sp. ATCC 53533]
MSNGAADQVNADLLATCAQVCIAAVIVVGIDAAAMHIAARAVSGGQTAATIHERVAKWRRTVPKWLTPVISMTSYDGSEPFSALDKRIRNDPFMIGMINCALVAGLVTAATMPILALVMAILGLWLEAPQLEGPVAATTICSVVLVAVLLYLQIRMRAKDIAQTAAGTRPATSQPLVGSTAATANSADVESSAANGTGAGRGAAQSAATAGALPMPGRPEN